MIEQQESDKSISQIGSEREIEYKLQREKEEDGEIDKQNIIEYKPQRDI